MGPLMEKEEPVGIIGMEVFVDPQKTPHVIVCTEDNRLMTCPLYHTEEITWRELPPIPKAKKL